MNWRPLRRLLPIVTNVLGTFIPIVEWGQPLEAFLDGSSQGARI